ARVLLLRALGAALRPVEGEDEGADRRRTGAAEAGTARLRAAGDDAYRQGRCQQPRVARHLPAPGRGLPPDVAPPLRVPAARLRRLHDLLRFLQEGLPRD